MLSLHNAQMVGTVVWRTPSEHNVLNVVSLPILRQVKHVFSDVHAS